MNITLNTISIENFKGVKKLTVNFNGCNAVISGETGVGKTSVYDALLWLWFGKDSTGRTDFGVRPVDDKYNVIRGLKVSVTAELQIDGRTTVIRKENAENIIKEQLKGYETSIWVDDEPMPVQKYKAYINELIQEDTFRLLTDTHYFNHAMHWTDRRAVLLDIAGNIGTPDGFDDLVAELNGKSVDGYKTALLEKKKRYTKERDEIAPRIDEIQHGLEQYAHDEDDAEELAAERDAFKAELNKIETERIKINESEQQRQENITLLNQAQLRLERRKNELENAGLDELKRQKSELEARRGNDTSPELKALNAAVTDKEAEIKSAKRQVERLQADLNVVRQKYTEVQKEAVEGQCYACGQALPASRIEEQEASKKKRLGEIATEGNQLLTDVNSGKKRIEEMEAELAELNTKRAEEQAAVTKAKVEIAQKISELSIKINKVNQAKKPDYSNDTIYADIIAEIETLQEAIGDPVTDQLKILDERRKAVQAEIEKLNSTLVQQDNIKKSRARINELTERQREIAQHLSAIEEKLEKIQCYKMCESKLIEDTVNGHFEIVNFQLFEHQLNGTIKETCEATLKGVPASDMSTGEKIISGVDVINTLSKHYGVYVPLFIDNAESVTPALQSETQVIELRAVRGQKKMLIELEKERQVA